MKKNKVLILISIIFLIVGVVFLVSGICWLVYGIRFQQKAVTVPAVITQITRHWDSDGDSDYDVFVDYSYEGEKYHDVLLNFYSSTMYQGKEIDILVDPKNPGRITSHYGNIIGSSIFIGLGTIFTLVSICLVVSRKIAESRRKRLMEQGRVIFGTVESIGLNSFYTVNGKHPYVVYCTYKDEYKDVVYRFRSEKIWTDPSPVIEPGSEIRIYVDNTNYSRYHVDVESLLDGKIIDYT